MAVRTVDIVVRVQAAGASRVMRRLAKDASVLSARLETASARSAHAWMSMGRAAEATGRVMTGVGAGILGVGYVAAKAATNFETSMTRIHTQAGVGQAAVAKFSKEILDLASSGQVAQGPNELASSLYHLASVGLRGKQAMDALKLSMEGAAIGGADAEATSSALAALWRTNMPGAGRDFSKAMGVINATVGQGNMRMEDLVHALGTGVMPAFKNAGLNVYDAGAALATFADAGYNVSSAAAQASTSLHFLYEPTTKAQKALASINMGAYQMAEDLHQPNGLLVAMKDLRSHLEALPGGIRGVQAENVLGAILPGGRGRILLTLLNNLDTYALKLGLIHKQTGQIAEDNKALQQTLGFKLHAAWSQIQADLIRFGDTLLPIIAKYLPTFTHDIIGVLTWLTKLPAPTKEFIAKLSLFLVIGGPILWTIGKLATTFARLKLAMLALRAAGAAAFAGESAAAAGLGVLTLAIRKFAPFAALYFALGASKKAVQAEKHHNVGRSAVQSGILGGGLGVIGATGAGALLGSPAGPPGMLVGAGAGFVAGAGVGVLRAIGVLHSGGYVGQSGIRKYDTGGYVNSDNRLAVLQVGEGVLNRTAMAGIGVGGLNALNSGNFGGLGGGLQIQSTPVYIMLDGRVLARAVLRQTLRKAARGPSSLVGGAMVTGVSSPVSR